MFWCPNGPRHQHSTREESRICWGIMLASPPVPVPAPVAPPARRDCPTPRMVSYVGILNGDVARARSMTFAECSAYIDLLKKGRSTVTTDVNRFSPSDRAKMLLPLLENVPDGYFAVRADDSEPCVFLRVKRPKGGKLAGCLKVQTQHGPHLSDSKFVRYASGDLRVYDKAIEEPIMLLVVNYKSAARLYSKEIGRCCRCNLELTDERSRHYGIGPDCEQVWPWVIQAVDEEDALARKL